MKKAYTIFKNIALSFMFFAMLACVLSYFAPFFRFQEDEDVTERLNAFYNQEKNTCDIVYLGTSATHCGILPLYIYDNYDITAINYAISGLPAETFEIAIDEILKYQTPKVICIELREYIRYAHNFTTGGEPLSERKQKLRRQYLSGLVNSLPASSTINRFKLVNKFAPAVLEEDEKLSEWQFEYLKTHKNWKDMGIKHMYEYLKNTLSGSVELNGFNKDYKIEEYKGTSRLTSVTPNDTPDMSGFTKSKPIEGEYLGILDGLVNKAKELEKQGIDVLFYTIPYPDQDKPDRAPYELFVGEYLKEKGMDFVSGCFNTDEIGIEYDMDYADHTGHNNIRGAKKVTDYFTKYLIENYDLKPTKLNKSQKEDWDTATKKWKKDELIPSEEYYAKKEAKREKANQ